MQLTVETSALYRERVKSCVPERIEQLRSAIEGNDFAKFGEIVMKESNQLHAVCLDTWPPLVYLNDASHHLIRLVTSYNKMCGEIQVAYTFDAGPNCCLILEEESLKDFLPYLCYYCKPKEFSGSKEKFILGLDEEEILKGLGDEVGRDLEGIHVFQDSVQYLVISQVGGGPSIVHGGTVE